MVVLTDMSEVSSELSISHEEASHLLQTMQFNTAGNIQQVEAVLLEEEQAACPVIHRFGPGTYIREVHIPAGTVAVGHHQNFEHMNIMLQGRVTVLQEDGSTSELKAPMMFVGKPGRKIGYIHEDVVWLNVYSTTETNVEVLEAALLTKSETWAEHLDNELKLLEYQDNDYEEMLNELGVTEELVRAQSENLSDQIQLPFGHYKIKTGRSKIQGTGLMATADIAENEVIAPARINGYRTIAGRFTNHAKEPNAEMRVNRQGDIDLVAIKPIKGCRGGHDGEEITVDYRHARTLALSLEAA